MNKTVLILGVFFCAGAAFWAYQTSGKSRAAQAELARIDADIRDEREQIEILRAEWAILTRPERLRYLVEQNFGNLELTQIRAENYGEPTEVPYVDLQIKTDDQYIDAKNIELILQDLIDSGEIEVQ